MRLEVGFRNSRGTDRMQREWRDWIIHPTLQPCTNAMRAQNDRHIHHNGEPSGLIEERSLRTVRRVNAVFNGGTGSHMGCTGYLHWEVAYVPRSHRSIKHPQPGRCCRYAPASYIVGVFLHHEYIEVSHE